MNDAAAWERLTAARVAHLATTAPRIVPITFAAIGRTLVHAVDHKPKATRALARLEDVARDPQVSVLVDRYDDEDWAQLWWVRADGAARVLDAGDPEAAAALDALAAKYAQYAERRPEGPVVAVAVRRVVSWSADGS